MIVLSLKELHLSWIRPTGPRSASTACRPSPTRAAAARPPSVLDRSAQVAGACQRKRRPSPARGGWQLHSAQTRGRGVAWERPAPASMDGRRWMGGMFSRPKPSTANVEWHSGGLWLGACSRSPVRGSGRPARAGARSSSARRARAPRARSEGLPRAQVRNRASRRALVRAQRGGQATAPAGHRAALAGRAAPRRLGGARAISLAAGGCRAAICSRSPSTSGRPYTAAQRRRRPGTTVELTSGTRAGFRRLWLWPDPRRCRRAVAPAGGAPRDRTGVRAASSGLATAIEHGRALQLRAGRERAGWRSGLAVSVR